tara:strand:+ start:15136 stop:15264 length:129 start_codon:yes stop_codon:yes gene_type:complete
MAGLPETFIAGCFMLLRCGGVIQMPSWLCVGQGRKMVRLKQA